METKSLKEQVETSINAYVAHGIITEENKDEAIRQEYVKRASTMIHDLIELSRVEENNPKSPLIVALFNELHRTHRAQQLPFIKALKAFLFIYGNGEGEPTFSDVRNEYAQHLAKHMARDEY